jgi:urease accessory protein
MPIPEPGLSWLPLLLQTSDAFFPTGAYAHSLGFEEYARLGGVKTEGDLQRYATEQILPALENQELPGNQCVETCR